MVCGVPSAEERRKWPVVTVCVHCLFSLFTWLRHWGQMSLWRCRQAVKQDAFSLLSSTDAVWLFWPVLLGSQYKRVVYSVGVRSSPELLILLNRRRKGTRGRTAATKVYRTVQAEEETSGRNPTTFLISGWIKAKYVAERFLCSKPACFPSRWHYGETNQLEASE